MPRGCPVPDGYANPRGNCEDTGATIYPGAVDGNGDGIDQDSGGADGQQASVGFAASTFTSIQAALNATTGGLTVWVGPGTWFEHELSFNGKTLASIAGADATVIDAQQQGLTSLLIDAGAPDDKDPDGSSGDLGIYGGSGADGRDLGLDGYFDYFWPGTLQDAPEGFDPGDYDSDDLDPSVPQSNGCGG